MAATIRTALRAIALTVALIAGSLWAAQAGSASTDGVPVPAGEFVACGYGAESTTADGCMPLPDALAAAANLRGDNTIVLLPGSYCPFTIDPVDRTSFDRLTIVGAGVAGIGGTGPVSFDGSEAALSTIKYSSTFCGDSPPGADISINGNDQVWQGVTLRNFAVTGTAGGPLDGINTTGADVPFTLRDMLVSGLSDVGLFYDASNDESGASMSVYNSAFIDNGTGVECPCEASIADSTFAGNKLGLDHDGSLELHHLTIAHNKTGVDIGSSGGQLDDSIIGDNVTDCTGTQSMESANQIGTNLLAPSCLESNSSTNGDITLTDTLAALDMTTQPTPSVAPPAQAIGAGDNLCGFSGTDQLEHSTSGLSTCDIGSVESAPSSSTPTASPSPTVEDFGKVPSGQTGTAAVTLSNTGAGLLAISQVSVSGAGFSIISDGCTYQSIPAGSCWVIVGASPSAPGDLSGTLTFTTNAGEQDVPLTVTGAQPLAAPGTVQATAGYRSVSLSWQPSPSEIDAGVDNTFDLNYAVFDSTDGGTTWNFADDVTGADSDTVSHLTNGQAYKFKVCTEDSYTNDNDGPCSDTEPSATPHTDASALTHPASRTINYGGSATLTTKLTDHATGGAIANAIVTLRSRPAGTTGAYGLVTTRTTGSTGSVSLSVKPARNTQYEWQYIGSGLHATTTSAAWTVSVAQVVNASLVHKSVRHGTATEAYGTVAPSATGESVTLQYWHHKWVTLTSVSTKLQTLPDKKHVVGYVLKHTFSSKGSYSLRVTRAATSKNTAGISRTLTESIT